MFICFAVALAPGAPPFNLTYTNLTSSSLLLSWDPPPAENHNGVLRRYVIEATEEETGSHLNLSSTGTDALISQLHPYYHYSIRVAAVTVSAGPPSHTLAIQMLEDGKIQNANLFGGAPPPPPRRIINFILFFVLV